MPLYVTILYLSISILLLVIGGLSVIKNKNSLANVSLLLFVVSEISMMLFIWLGYYFVDPVSPELSTFFIRATFPAAILLSFSLASFAYYFPRKNFSVPDWMRYAFIGLTIFMAIFSGSTDLFYEAEVIVDGQLVGDKHGPLHSLYIFHYLMNCVIAILLLNKKKSTLDGIEKKKITIALSGVLTVALTTIIFYTILPKFDIYLIQHETNLFSLVFVILTFYSIVKYRFLDIKFTVSRIVKVSIALVGAACISYVLISATRMLFPDLYSSLHTMLGIAYGTLFFLLFFRFFKSHMFHNFFSTKGVEYFQQVLSDFRYKNITYRNLRELERSIKENFCKKLKIKSARIILLDQKTRKKYPKLIQYFEYSEEILVRQEIALVFRQTLVD